jgi:hypothetical protein
MTDETQAETSKRPPGRPKGSTTKRHVKQPPPRRHDFDPLPETFTHSPYEPTSVFEIDRDTLKAIKDDHGVELIWVTTEVAGKEFPFFLTQRLKNHGQVVEGRNVFGGKISHLCNAEGRYVRENAILVAMPVEVCEMSRAYERRKAKEAISQMQASHKLEGIPGISMPGGNDPVARTRNTHRQSYEPTNVPD